MLRKMLGRRISTIFCCYNELTRINGLKRNNSRRDLQRYRLPYTEGRLSLRVHQDDVVRSLPPEEVQLLNRNIF